MFINGEKDVWPTSCLSYFSLVSILFAIFTAGLKSSIRNKTQYDVDGSVFLKTSKSCGSL